MSEHDDADRAPLNVGELKMRLLYGDSRGVVGQLDLLRELIDQPTAALPLIPVVVAQYRAGKLLGVASLFVELYLKTHDTTLLDSLREKGDFRWLNMHEKSALFADGVADLEDELLQYLWTAWTKPTEPARRDVVSALGKCGGPKALEMLQTIRSALDANNAERRARVHYQDDDDEDGDDEANFLGRLELKANESFIIEVRDACRELTNRQALGGERDKNSS